MIEPPNNDEPRVIVAGFGRVGHLVGSMLDEHKISYIAMDMDANLVARERKAGFPIYYGDAANPEFLKKCGLATATAIAVTMDSAVRVDDVVGCVDDDDSVDHLLHEHVSGERQNVE